MFCGKCGTQVKDGEKFCSGCGAPVAGANETAKAEPAPQAQPTEAAKKEKKAKKSPIIPILIAVVLAIFALLLIVVMAVTGKKSVKLDKYITVEFEGYNTVGTATYSFDATAFVEDYDGKIKVNKSGIKKEAKKSLKEDYDSEYVDEMIETYLEDPAQLLADAVCYSGSLDKSSGLSNGDVVNFTWSVDEEMLEIIFKCDLKYSDLEVKVKGLEELEVFDPFEGITVEYTGMAPNGYANINRDTNRDEYGYLRYSLDKSDGLTNGDTVTVTVDYNSSEEYFAEQFGKLASPTEKTYTVEGLASYITKAEQIPEDLITQMQSQCEDIIRSYAAKSWKDYVAIEELTYLGNYFLSNKDNSYGTDTRCYMVYKITAKQSMETVDKGLVIENTDSYYYVCFHDPMLDVDGKGAVDISYYDTPYDSFTVETEHIREDDWRTYYFEFTYKGYDSLEKLYNEVVTKNMESYTHEDNVTE